MNAFNFQDICQLGMEANPVRITDYWLALSTAATVALVLCLLGFRKVRELEMRCNREMEINAELTNRNMELQSHRKSSGSDSLLTS